MRVTGRRQRQLSGCQGWKNDDGTKGGRKKWWRDPREQRLINLRILQTESIQFVTCRFKQQLLPSIFTIYTFFFSSPRLFLFTGVCLQLTIHVGHKIETQMRPGCSQFRGFNPFTAAQYLHVETKCFPVWQVWLLMNPRPVRLEPQTRLVQWIMGRFFFAGTKKVPLHQRNASFKTENEESLQTNEWNEAPLHFTDGTQGSPQTRTGLSSVW